MEPPPGGPVDRTPPFLVAVSPDSGAVGVGPLKKIRLTFSEKMDRKSATSWLYFFPDQRIRKTSWKGATMAEIELEDPLPRDTVVVVEVAAGLADAHGPKMQRSRRFPIATGDSIPAGRITGVLVMGDSALSGGVIELYNVPPDTLEYFQQPLLRRASTAEDGSFVFEWLPVPGGPWLLRAFNDANRDRRPAENEPKRLLRDTLSLTDAHVSVSAGVTTLFAVDTPGRLHLSPFGNFGSARPVMAWSMAAGEVDTGWAPQPVTRGQYPLSFIDPDTNTTLGEVKPGLNHVGFFVDVDGDTAFSAVPESLLAPLRESFAWALHDTAADTSGWYLEPWLIATSPVLEPGLDADLAIPDTTITITPWPRPAPAPMDSTATDSLAATPQEKP